jgi:hypothetical protein
MSRYVFEAMRSVGSVLLEYEGLTNQNLAKYEMGIDN